MAEPLNEEQQQKRRQAVRDLMPTTPFLAGLGIVFERYEPDDSPSGCRSATTSPTTVSTSTAG